MINKIQILDIPVVEDVRGNLGVIEMGLLPFDFKRVYYLFDVPSSASRGGHSHILQKEVLIALSGSFEVVIHDGCTNEKYILNKPNRALLIPAGFWRELENFSSGAVCLVLASDGFDEEDYIRNFDEFLESKK